MRLANQSQTDGSSIIDIIKTLILNDDGTEVIQGDSMLPTDVLMAAITTLTARLGK